MNANPNTPGRWLGVCPACGTKLSGGRIIQLANNGGGRVANDCSACGRTDVGMVFRFFPEGA